MRDAEERAEFCRKRIVRLFFLKKGKEPFVVFFLLIIACCFHDLLRHTPTIPFLCTIFTDPKANEDVPKKIQRKALTEMFPQLFPNVTLLPISSIYQQKKLIMKFFIHTIDVHVGVQYHCN